MLLNECLSAAMLQDQESCSMRLGRHALKDG